MATTTFLVLNTVEPYKEIGSAQTKPETPVIQLEHNGQKWEGVECHYPVKEFGPPVRPAEYKKQYKNFYGFVID